MKSVSEVTGLQTHKGYINLEARLLLSSVVLDSFKYTRSRSWAVAQLGPSQF